MEEIIKKKAGRPKNSVSYIGMKLSDIQKMLTPDTVIFIDKGYRILARTNKLSVLEVTTEQLQDIRNGGQDDNVLEFVITDYSNEEVSV